MRSAELLLYLGQNYLSGIVKRKAAFRELEPALGAAVGRRAVGVPESEAHRLESAARPDLPLLELLRELSAGLRLTYEHDAATGALEPPDEFAHPTGCYRHPHPPAAVRSGAQHVALAPALQQVA